MGFLPSGVCLADLLNQETYRERQVESFWKNLGHFQAVIADLFVKFSVKPICERIPAACDAITKSTNAEMFNLVALGSQNEPGFLPSHVLKSR